MSEPDPLLRWPQPETDMPDPVPDTALLHALACADEQAAAAALAGLLAALAQQRARRTRRR